MRSQRHGSAQRSYRRTSRALLFVEPLEERRLLATFVDAVNDSAATNEDTPVTVSVMANDTSDTPLSPPKVVSVSQPASGSATINPNQTVTYTPQANFSGTDTFTYTIWDSSSRLLEVTPGQSTLDLHARANSSTQSSTMDYDFGTNMQSGTTSRLSESVFAESSSNGTVRMGAFAEATWASPAQGQIFLNNVVFDRLYSREGSASLAEGSGWTYQFTPTTSGMFILEHDIRVTDTYGLQSLGEFRLGWSHGTTNTFQLINADNRANAFGQTALPVQGGVTYTVSLHNNFGLAWGSPFDVTDREAMIANFNFRIVETPLADTATVTVSVGSVSEAPIAEGWQFSTDQEVPLHDFLRASDPDGDALSYSVVQNPSYGSLTIDASTGDFVYTPQAGYIGTDSFTYRVNDGTYDSNIAQVFVTVRDRNDPPVANDDVATTNEDTTVNIFWWSNDTDPDGEAPSLVSFTQPANGTVTLGVTAPFFRYTPNPNFSGIDSFSYTIKDRAGLQDTATVTVSVAGVNDRPIANNVQLATDEDSAATGQATGFDVESAVTFAVATMPAHGTLSSFNTQTGTFVYTPSPNFHGTDSFTFTASDGAQISEPGTVTITVAPVNDGPIASVAQYATQEDTPLQSYLRATDLDGDRLTFWIVDEPASGGIQVNRDTGAFTYTPDPEFHGADSFTFRVHDGVSYSAPVSISVTVREVNDPPVTDSQQLVAAEDGSANGQLTASDVDSPAAALTFAVVTHPAHGSLELDPATGGFSYVPHTNFAGDDFFTFTANDGNKTSNRSTVYITVTPVNDPPVALGQTVTSTEDTPFSGQLMASDLEGSPLTFTVASQPRHGILTSFDSATGAYTYLPAANFAGSDWFSFVASDGTAVSNEATIVVSVAAVNDLPVAHPSQLAALEDATAAGTVSGDDVESTITFTVSAQPSHGTLVLNSADGAFTYSPHANFHGTDSFEFTVSDGELSSEPAKVSITISPVNDSPVATGAAIVTDEDAPLHSTLSASDIDGDSLTYSIVAQPTSGAVQVDAQTGAFTYTPNPNYSGTDTFTFRVFDGQAYSATVPVSVTVRELNDLPTLIDQVFTLAENEQPGTAVGTVLADDIEDTNLTFALSGPEAVAFAINSSTGEITVANGGLLDYETNQTFQFAVHVTDSEGGRSTANVTVNLTDVLEMAIDIAPGDSTNRLDLGSSTIEVAILALPGFNPLEQVDLGSLRLGRPGATTGASVQSHPKHGYKYELRDVNGDGRADLVVKFTTSDTGLKVGDTSLQLSGKLRSGESFLLEQAVMVVASSKGGGKGGGGGGGKGNK